MSRPSVSPAAETASAIRSSAARLDAQVGREAALVAEAGGQALLLQHRLERVVDLGALAQRLAERGRPDRRDHELLHVDVGVGVRAAVEDVHHRHRQQVGVGAADVAVERQAGGVGGGAGHGERDAEDRVGAELGLVGRAVELEHGLVDEPLVVGGDALDRRRDPLRRRRRRPCRRPCRRSGRRRRAARPPRRHRWTRRWAPWRARTRRRRAGPRPRRWGCRASRGSRGRRRLRWMPRSAPLVVGRRSSRSA